MKTLSVSWFAYIFAFAFLHSTTKNNNEEAVKKVLAYKQENTISCGANKTSLTSNGYAFTYLPFADRNYNLNFFDASYNNLFIPDTLSGTDFTLRIHDSTKQYLSGLATATSAY